MFFLNVEIWSKTLKGVEWASLIILLWYDQCNLWFFYCRRSSSCHAASTDLPGPLLSPFSIIHCSWLVFKAIPCISTELLYIGSRWSSCNCRPCEGVHKSISLMSLSLFLQQCPTCLVRITWIVFVMGDRWPYGCVLWSAAFRIYSVLLTAIVQLLSFFFSIRLVSVHVVCIHITVSTRPSAWKKLRFILSVRSNFHMTSSLSIAVHAFVSCLLISLWVDEILLPR